jgi:hypothetical protein
MPTDRQTRSTQSLIAARNSSPLHTRATESGSRLQGLSEKLQDFVLYAIAMVPSADAAQSTSASSALARVRSDRHLQCSARPSGC